jgi:signal recognition particle subunit SRP54
MFDQLGGKLQNTFKKLTGKGKLSEKDIDEALREIRMALLEADVNYKVVKGFLAGIREQAIGEEVMKSLTPGQQVVKIVQSEMTKLLGSETKELRFGGKSPFVILMAGVQGSGKTTSSGKLASYLKAKNRTVLLAACDTQRAAAVDQLKVLGEKIGVPVFSEENKSPQEIAKDALKDAKEHGIDVLIVDTGDVSTWTKN